MAIGEIFEPCSLRILIEPLSVHWTTWKAFLFFFSYNIVTFLAFLPLVTSASLHLSKGDKYYLELCL